MLSGRRLRNPRPGLAAAALACMVTLLSLESRAQSSSDDMARRHFESGAAYLEESDYESALKAFEKAYELSKRPEILLNVATVHERRGDLPAAVTALQSYLQAAPDGERSEAVKLRIQNLEKRIQDQQKPAEAPAPLPEPGPPAPKAPPAPTAATSPPPAAPKAEPNRWPAYIALGSGGVLAGGSLLTGLLAQSKYDSAKHACSPNCSDAQISGSRTLAITSTVLTGAAAIGVGLGVALLLTTGSDSEVGGLTPRFDLALGPQSAATGATWSF